MNLKNCYEKSIDYGKLELTGGKKNQMLNESCKMDLEDDSTYLSPPVACTPTSANTTNTVIINEKKCKIVSFFVR